MLSTLDNVANFDCHARRMGISGDEFLAMIDFHHLTIGWVKLLDNDNPTRRRQYGGSSVGSEVQPGVQSTLSSHGVNPPSKARARAGVPDRPFRGQQCFANAINEELPLHVVQSICTDLGMLIKKSMLERNSSIERFR